MCGCFIIPCGLRHVVLCVGVFLCLCKARLCVCLAMGHFESVSREDAAIGFYVQDFLSPHCEDRGNVHNIYYGVAFLNALCWHAHRV